MLWKRQAKGEAKLSTWQQREVLGSISYGVMCIRPVLPHTEQQLAEEKKKAHSLTDVMRKPTKVVLLKVVHRIFRTE